MSSKNPPVVNWDQKTKTSRVLRYNVIDAKTKEPKDLTGATAAFRAIGPSGQKLEKSVEIAFEDPGNLGYPTQVVVPFVNDDWDGLEGKLTHETHLTLNGVTDCIGDGIITVTKSVFQV